MSFEGAGVKSNPMDFFPTSYGSGEYANAEDGGTSGDFSSFNSFGTLNQEDFILSREGKNANPWTGAYDDEAPLLEELGINLSHIWTKTVAVLHPTRDISSHIMDDTDMAGPLVIGLLLGVSLLLRGKLHFGYIYGFGLVGCLSMWLILNLMSERGIDIIRVISVLGYCLLPMVLLACGSRVLPLNGMVGLILATIATVWCTRAASNMFVAVLHMVEQRMLVAYPVGLIYACFAMMAVF